MGRDREGSFVWPIPVRLSFSSFSERANTLRGRSFSSVFALTPIDIEDYLGVDLGIKNIACDSEGTVYSAKHLLNVRHRYRRLRKKLQAKGIKSAKRLLKKMSGRESRFANDVNHCISKKLVKRAKDSGRGLALEDLTHIRTRVTVRRKQRDQLHSWSFADLREKIEYKAERQSHATRWPVKRLPACQFLLKSVFSCQIS